MRRSRTALLLVSIVMVLASGCATSERDMAEPQSFSVASKPAIPVTVDVSELPDGQHTVYARDGNRLIAHVHDKAITGLRLADTSNRDVPIHTVKRLSKDGKTYVTEDADRMPHRRDGAIGIAPPFVPGDCGLVYAGSELWWVCATTAGTTVTSPPPPTETILVK